jgi:hypothetical protein
VGTNFTRRPVHFPLASRLSACSENSPYPTHDTALSLQLTLDTMMTLTSCTLNAVDVSRSLAERHHNIPHHPVTVHHGDPVPPSRAPVSRSRRGCRRGEGEAGRMGCELQSAQSVWVRGAEGRVQLRSERWEWACAWEAVMDLVGPTQQSSSSTRQVRTAGGGLLYAKHPDTYLLSWCESMVRDRFAHFCRLHHCFTLARSEPVDIRSLHRSVQRHC